MDEPLTKKHTIHAIHRAVYDSLIIVVDESLLSQPNNLFTLWLFNIAMGNGP